MIDMKPIHDHGYVKLIETWGSDERIIESARMSTAGGFKGWGPSHAGDCPAGQIGSGICDCAPTSGDEKLLRYLWDHKHMSVFEQAGMTVEIQAPIFVAREVFRHRTFSFNELSARYVELPNLSYIPSLERLGNGRQSSKNKQGSVNGLSDFESRYMQGAIELASKAARVQYEELLHLGLSRELARLVIPMNQYTRWRMSGNLRNWLGMLELRLGEGVQLETRDYAVAIGQMVADKFPKTWELFDAKL